MNAPGTITKAEDFSGRIILRVEHDGLTIVVTHDGRILVGRGNEPFWSDYDGRDATHRRAATLLLALV